MKPNPGSKEALDQGCLCAVMDNAYGKGYLGGVKGKDGNIIFVVTDNCPLHGVNIKEDNDRSVPKS